MTHPDRIVEVQDSHNPLVGHPRSRWMGKTDFKFMPTKEQKLEEALRQNQILQLVPSPRNPDHHKFRAHDPIA